MTTHIVIGANCSHCILDVLRLQNSSIILALDHPREPAVKPDDIPNAILEFHKALEYSITATATYGTITYPRMPSKREERQAQQPFYRNLKKYRKP